MTTLTEKNHNKHLDLLQDYKIHLIKYIEELEKLDKQSEFAKKWNETTIKERKQEIQVIDKIIKNLIRF
jgi:ribosomal protein S25